jgi:hypothetical protein
LADDGNLLALPQSAAIGRALIGPRVDVLP